MELQSFIGEHEATIRNGYLRVPKALRAFNSVNTDYALEQSVTEGYRYLTVFPKEILKKSIVESSTVDLEARLRNNKREIKVPEKC